MGTRSRNAIVSIFLLLIVTYFSIHWMIPIWKEQATGGAYRYLPIHYYPGSYSDDYFYYSRIREVIDGHIYSGDHATIEHKFESTPHATYSFSFFLGSVGGWISKQTQHAYFTNFVVFPALSFIGLVILGLQMELSVGVVVAISAYVLLSSVHVERTPNCLITNVFLNFLAICLYQKFERRNASRRWDLALIFLLGISSVTSVPNMFISYGLFAAFCVSYAMAAKNTGLQINWKGYAKILVASLLVSTPGFYFIIQELIGKTPDFMNFAIPPLEQYSGIHWDQAKASLSQFLSLPVMIALAARYPLKRFHVTVLLSALATYVAVSLLRGSFLARYIFLRGGEVLIWFIVYSACAHFLMSFLRGERAKTFGKVAVTLLVAASLAQVGFAIDRKRAETLASLQFHDLPELKDLSEWSVRHVPPGHSAITLDFDLITSIGVYTPFDTYVAFAHQSPVSTPERHRRFYESILFFGQDREFLERRLRLMQSNDQTGVTDPAQIDLSLMQLVMFYGLYSDGKIPEDKITEMLADFDNVAKEAASRKSVLTFKGDYLVLSKLTEAFIAPGSPADQVRKKSKPVFQNSKYSVYSI